MMKDGFGREIDYLRISVTDKCNLRCRYCMPGTGLASVQHGETLTLEEIFKVVRIMESLGIKKLRLTGGEPLVRKNLVNLIRDISSLEGIEDIAMTTNGILLKEQIGELKAVGLGRVNISLDACDRETFCRITGYDGLAAVLEAIDAALDAGMQVKINCVPCRELNEGEVEHIAWLAHDKMLDVRFIELMPIGCGKDFHGIASEEILMRLKNQYGEYQMLPAGKKTETARYYWFEGFRGKIGFISPISHPFCGDCNRIRLMADGRLKLCLHYDRGIDIQKLLRQGKSDAEIREEIAVAVKNKPKAHTFNKVCTEEEEDYRKMVQIGG